VRLAARCLRGLEWICAGELAGRIGARPARVEHRVVEFEAAVGPHLLSAGTADDVFLVAADFAGIDHRRSALSELQRQTERLDVEAPVAAVGRLRPVGRAAPFEVVASFLGRRNYNRYTVEEAVGTVLERLSGRRFLPGPARRQVPPELSWRVHLFDRGGFLGLRLPAVPLHRRSYKLASREGTLHPPLAFAAALLGGPAPGDLLLDPFCGAGTMLLEAGRLQPGAHLVGSDLDPEAVRAARANAAGAAASPRWLVGDAGRLAVRESAVDLVTTNPPWRRRLAPRGRLVGGIEPFWREARRVLRPGGRLVTAMEELEGQAGAIRAAGLAAVVLQRVAVSGAWLTLALHCAPERWRAELDRLRTGGLRPPAEALAPPPA
jgi:23S rRNA G2445 N2-methylase RlmL